VPIGGEGCEAGDLPDETFQLHLQPLWKLDVFDGPALDAHEMMVMTGQPFGHLVPGDPPCTMMRLDHPRLFEDRQ